MCIFINETVNYNGLNIEWRGSCKHRQKIHPESRVGWACGTWEWSGRHDGLGKSVIGVVSYATVLVLTVCFSYRVYQVVAE